MTTPRRILAIKLADLGDVLNITPALRALRHTYPQARLDVLLNPHTAGLLRGSPLADEVVLFPKTSFEGLDVFHPRSWLPLSRYVRDLRQRRYDTVINFHHLTTRLGRAKQRALIRLSGAPVTVGLDNGHGHWFTHPVPDQGFGARREVEYWLALARRLGASAPDRSLYLPATAADRAFADGLLDELGLAGRDFAILHPGSGGFSLARRWDPPKFAALAAALLRRFDLPSVLVGTPADDTAAVIAHATTPLPDLSG
ncbi:MAG: glycosyl transferase, partial [Caldilineae bacterium]